jgi:MFS transporter, UMF1 family
MSLITDDILEQMDKKKTILAWSFYDWANSAFATTVMAGFLPDFFRNYYAATLASADITFYLGLANSIASLIIVFLAPFLGAVADKMAGKKRLLLFFAIQGILMTGLLVIVAEGYWVWALVLYILGTVGFSGANTFYDSLLPAVASEKKIDYTSSLGFSLGYIGGGLLFAGNVAMFLLMDDSVLAIKLSFLSVAVWWAVFTVPIM